MKLNYSFLTSSASKRLMLAFVLLSLCLFANAATRVQVGDLYYNISGTTATVAPNRFNSFTSDYREWSYEIPEKIYYNRASYTVVGIDDYAFSAYYSENYGIEGSELRSISIPNTVKTIGYGAFRGCPNLRTVTINGTESKLEEIGGAAFMDCAVLSEIRIPSQVKTLGKNVFNNSYIQTVEYFGATPPENWVAASNTYVTNKKNYDTPPFSIAEEPKIIEFISFENNEFTYNGQNVSTQWHDNRYTSNSSWSVTTTIPEFEKNAGDYCVNITFSYSLSYNKYYNFDIVIPFYYTIKPASLSVSVKNVTRLYGEPNPPFELNYNGFIGSENISNIDVQPIVQTNITSMTDIGSYSIVPSNGIARNYEFNYIAGLLNITKAPIKVRVSDETREYGLDNPTFAISYVGLKNGEQSPKWDKAPIFSTDASKGSNVGRYPITVNCEPHNYEIITNENGTLSITPAPLTLTANNCYREYYEPNPKFTFTLEGLRNNDDERCLSNKPMYDCSAVISSDCGEYDITPSLAESTNYAISYSSGVLTVKKAALTISADNISKEYGDENPVLRFSIIGLKGDDTQDAALQQLPSLATSASTNTSVGEYPITVGGGISKNYQLAYRQGIMTITKAPLSVSVEDVERSYGTNNPNFTRNYLGFKLADTETTAFSVLPKISCSATKASDVGEYPITITGGTARNYEIVFYENGTLSITKAIATITANNKSRLYFEENPQFDFSVTGLLNGDSKSCLTTLPKYNCNANRLSNVGDYEIMPSGAVSKNYTFEYASGILTVNKQQLAASVGSYSRVYGENNPSFAIDYVGFVNNENASVLTQAATASCPATSVSDVGTYPINLTGGEATNYYISKYNSGTLTITKANQKIVWNQDLSNIVLYSQIELQASSDANLPVTYEMSPNNVATLYSNAGKWYLDCYGSGTVNIRAVQNGDKNHNAATAVSKTLIVLGGGGDPSDPQIFLNVEEPGTLPTLIAENRKYQIKNLRLTCNINGTDINFIREMAGSDSYGSTTPGVLETLDISGCTIVSGGRSYYQSNRTSDYAVGNHMFYNCKVLTTLRLPENSISIGNSAFADCDRLSVIAIPNSVKSFGTKSFANAISLLRIPMPEYLTTIGDMAFMGCNGITELTLPESVSSIGDGIVNDCQNLSQIDVEVGNSHYASKDGVLYDSDFHELLIFPVNHEKTEYSVVDEVTSIAPYAFLNAKKLTTVNLPSTLASIGKDAFIGCVNLSMLQVKALNPPICQNDCFENVSKTRCELQVPLGCRSYYWVAPVWSEFNRIVESGFTGIENVESNGVHFSVQNGSINISGCPRDVVVRIYQTNGTLVFNSNATEGLLQFTPNSIGTYILLIGNTSYKILIK